MAQAKTDEVKQRINDMEIQKQSGKSSSLISSSSSSDSSVSQRKYQKKQLQSSKKEINDKTESEKLKKKQNKYSSRSRSPSSSQKESRSMKKQKKSHRSKNRSRQTSDSFRSRDDKKDKYRNQRYRDQKSSKYRDQRDSRDRNRNRQRQRQRERQRERKPQRDYRDRDNKYDDRRDRKDRDRSRQKYRNDKKDNQKDTPKDNKQINNAKLLPTQIPMPPIEVPMPPIPGQRRRRQRSRSPLGYYRRNQNNNQGQFWDSFSWVPRMNYTPNVSSSALINTKKMRRLMITNIPFQMGISKDDLRELITRFMTQNYLKDSMNNCPVRDLQIDEEEHSVAVQLSSVEETCRMCKLQKIQLFKGAINGIIRLGDSCYGNNIVTQAQNAAQAQAAAFAAINVLENKKTTFNMEAALNKGPQTSTMIRVTNAVTAYMIQNMPPQQMDDYFEDLLEGFSQYGKIVHNWFVKPNQKDICANPGDLFIQYEAQQDAMKAMDQMQGKFYDQRVIKLYYIPREIYYPNYKKDLTPPTIKAPPKAKKQNPVSNFPQISKSAHIASKPQ